MVTTIPVQRKRCPLCLSILELSHVTDGGVVSRVAFADRHKPAECARATEERIRVLEQIHQRDAFELESQSNMINDLGEWIGLASELLDVGKRWIVHRDKRVEDIGRLRKAFSTGDREIQHPLWQAEQELADAIRSALELLARRKPT